MRKAPEHINRLDHKQIFALTNYVAAHYAASNLSDKEFAAQHQEAFGCPLTEGNILGARRTLDLPSNREARMAKHDAVGDCLGLTARIQHLEETLSKLQRTVINLQDHLLRKQ